MSAALEEHVADVEGRPVRFRIAGSGPPLVLVHGLAGSTRWWRPVLPALAARHAVHLVDLPGFGAMRGGLRLAPTQAAAWLRAWLEEVELGPATLVGHSLGAAVVLRAGSLDPVRVARLVLIAPAGVGPRRSLVGHALPLADELRRSRPRFLATLGVDALRAGPRTLLHGSRGVLAEDLAPELGRVEAPTLVLLGARDRLIPLEAGTALGRGLRDARVEVLDGSGHVPMFDEPERVADAILGFAERS